LVQKSCFEAGKKYTFFMGPRDKKNSWQTSKKFFFLEMGNDKEIKWLLKNFAKQLIKKP
jgi:hypothetical protein